MFTVHIDAKTAALAELHLQLSPARRPAFMGVLGKTGEKVYRQHFQTRETDSPNKMGWPRQHFWRRIKQATAYDPSRTTADTATIVVSDPALAAKIDGAVIRPTGGRRLLAIPMHRDAYGHRPSDGTIPGLIFVGGRFGQSMYLARRNGQDRFGNLEFFYRLVPQAVVPRDPRALPERAQVGAALATAARAFLGRENRRN